MKKEFIHLMLSCLFYPARSKHTMEMRPFIHSFLLSLSNSYGGPKYRASSTFQNSKNVQSQKKRKAGPKEVKNADLGKERNANMKEEENTDSKEREILNGKSRKEPIQKWSHMCTKKREKLPFKNEDKSTEVGETSIDKESNPYSNWRIPIHKGKEFRLKRRKFSIQRAYFQSRKAKSTNSTFNEWVPWQQRKLISKERRTKQTKNIPFYDSMNFIQQGDTLSKERKTSLYHG